MTEALTDEEVLTQFFVAVNQDNEDVMFQSARRFLAALVRKRTSGDEEDKEEEEEEEEGSANALLEMYVAQSPECRELHDLMNGLSQGNTSQMYVCLLKLYGVIISRVSDPLRAAKLSRHLLRTHTKRFYASISSKSMHVVKATLKLFASIVGRSSACAQVLYQHVDIEHKYFPALLGANIGKGRGGGKRKSGGNPPARGTMLHFVTSLLRCNASNVQRGIVCARSVMGAAMMGLHRDAVATMRRFLDALGTVLIRERSIDRGSKAYFFSAANAPRVAKLLNGTAQQQGAASVFVRRLVLRTSATKRAALRNETVVLRLLHAMNPFADSCQQSLVLEILEQHPGLIDKYVCNMSCALEPKLSLAFLSNAAVLTKVMALARGTCVSEVVVPRALTRASLSRGLQHADPLVQLATANIIVSVLERYSSALSPRDVQKREASLRSICPEPQILIRLLTSSAVLGDDKCESRSWIQVRVLSLLQKYVYVLPVTMASVRFDWRRLVVDVPTEGGNCATAKRVELVRLLRTIGPDRCEWLRAKGARAGAFVGLLRLFVSTKLKIVSVRRPSLAHELVSTTRKLLLDTLLYEVPLLTTSRDDDDDDDDDDDCRRRDEACVWLEELTEDAISFFADTIVAVVAKPFDATVVRVSKDSRLSALGAAVIERMNDDSRKSLSPGARAYAMRVLFRVVMLSCPIASLADVRKNFEYVARRACFDESIVSFAQECLRIRSTSDSERKRCVNGLDILRSLCARYSSEASASKLRALVDDDQGTDGIASVSLSALRFVTFGGDGAGGETSVVSVAIPMLCAALADRNVACRCEPRVFVTFATLIARRPLRRASQAVYACRVLRLLASAAASHVRADSSTRSPINRRSAVIIPVLAAALRETMRHIVCPLMRRSVIIDLLSDPLRYIDDGMSPWNAAVLAEISACRTIPTSPPFRDAISSTLRSALSMFKTNMNLDNASAATIMSCAHLMNSKEVFEVAKVCETGRHSKFVESKRSAFAVLASVLSSCPRDAAKIAFSSIPLLPLLQAVVQKDCAATSTLAAKAVSSVLERRTRDNVASLTGDEERLILKSSFVVDIVTRADSSSPLLLRLVRTLALVSAPVCRAFVSAIIVASNSSCSLLTLYVGTAWMLHAVASQEKTSEVRPHDPEIDERHCELVANKIVSTILRVAASRGCAASAPRFVAAIQSVRTMRELVVDAPVSETASVHSDIRVIVDSAMTRLQSHVASLDTASWTALHASLACALLRASSRIDATTTAPTKQRKADDALCISVLEYVVAHAPFDKTDEIARISIVVASFLIHRRRSRGVPLAANLQVRVAQSILRSNFKKQWALRLVRSFIEWSSQSDPETCATLWTMLWGHSSFLSLLSSRVDGSGDDDLNDGDDEDGADDNTHSGNGAMITCDVDSMIASPRRELLRLMCTVARGAPEKCCAQGGGTAALRVVRCLLAAYDASLSVCDRHIYELIRLYETHTAAGPNALDYRWGAAALSKDSARGDDIRDRDFSWLFEDGQIRPRRLRRSIDHIAFISTAAQQDGDTPRDNKLGMSTYDPRYLLSMMLRMFDTVGSAPLRKLVSSGLLGYVAASLSSPDLESVRRPAYEILGRFYEQLQLQQTKGLLAGGFSERPQVQLLLDTLQGGIEKPLLRIPTLMGIFVAEALSVLLRPGHATYPQLNAFLLARPALDLGDVPLFYNLFNSGRSTYRIERMWILKLLARGLQNDVDCSILCRRHVYAVFMSFYESDLGAQDLAARGAVRRFFLRAARVPASVDHLLRRSAIGTWFACLVTRVDDELTLEWIVRTAREIISTVAKGKDESLRALARGQFCSVACGLLERSKSNTSANLTYLVVQFLHDLVRLPGATSTANAFICPELALHLMTALIAKEKDAASSQRRHQRAILRIVCGGAVSARESFRSGSWSELSQRVLSTALDILKSSANRVTCVEDAELVEEVLGWVLDAYLSASVAASGYAKESGKFRDVHSILKPLADDLDGRVRILRCSTRDARASRARASILSLLMNETDAVPTKWSSTSNGACLFYLNSLLILTCEEEEEEEESLRLGHSLQACIERLPSPILYRKHARFGTVPFSKSVNFDALNASIFSEMIKKVRKRRAVENGNDKSAVKGRGRESPPAFSSRKKKKARRARSGID